VPLSMFHSLFYNTNMTLGNLKGVGTVTLTKLEKLGITDVDSLLSHYPKRYIDRRKALKVVDLKLIEDENYHCTARITKLKMVRLRNRRTLIQGILEDDTGYIAVTWFNNPYVMSQFDDDDAVVFSGQIFKGKVSNPKMKKVESPDDIAAFARVESIYPETRGLKSYTISKFVQEYLQYVKMTDSAKQSFETLPKRILSAEKLLGRSEAIYGIHFPDNDDLVKQARERLGFEEIYTILKEVQKRKKLVQKYDAHQVRINTTAHELLLDQLSFTLTESQKTALREIFTDISTKKPMHRLLNGDVGSGKTIVAAAAAWQVVNNGLQVVILAPTGVLANQHYLTFQQLFSGYDIPIHLATSDTRKGVEQLAAQINDSSDQNHIFIGTHALLYRMELLKKVGLLVIDEQHKFGVKQREVLENLQSTIFNLQSDEKVDTTMVPHVLSMSATPIPRSLALTLFGDIEVSFLEAKPMGRKKIVTRIVNEPGVLDRMYAWIREEVAKNAAQVYVVCPLIEESEKLDVKSAMQEFERLQAEYPEFTIELLHGKIKPKVKDEILQRFREGVTQILVSTSVIEVGIDNPNATIMVVEGAERFGLAQLHQIRGRVGRSDKQSYCFLKTSDGNSSDRMEFFAETNDGFKVAEFDLAKRGPGEVYGESQSGIPDLKIANILDIALIKRVKKYIT
jgi:ATP-dependent DNA helicase RecG